MLANITLIFFLLEMFRASDFKTYFCILVKFTNHIIKISTKLQNSILSAPKKAKLFKTKFF